MMFSDEEIKEIPESGFVRQDDEIIIVREVWFKDKNDKKESSLHSEPLLPNSNRSESEGHRSLFRDGFFPEGMEHQLARFAWTEEDGNIASLVSEPGFGTTGQTTFGKDLDAALKSEMKEADTSSAVFYPTNRNGLTFTRKSSQNDTQQVTSTSTVSGPGVDRPKTGNSRVDKADPRSRFHYVKYVKRHGRTVKLWECGICSREFQHQYTLMRHLPTHTDERNFHCDACGKSFRQLSTLSQHRAIHSAARPYACEVCNKTFNRVSTLISHRKTHSDEKPYKCHICPKGFHQKGNLRNHLFTHTNERPYRCNICLKGFNQQSNLVCHKNKAHPDDSSCSIVGPVSGSASRNSQPISETQPDATRTQNSEVSSSVGPYLPSVEGPSTSAWIKTEPWEFPKYCENSDIWGDTSMGLIGSGVIVDPIKTYHMGVALATKQTPFALLKPDNEAPVLVKVVDVKLPGGKQMLVPATAEDLRVGGKIVVNNEEEDASTRDRKLGPTVEVTGAVQIRVPVVATVVPKIKPGGRLQLTVEEPHHAYHTALSTDVGEPAPCSKDKPLTGTSKGTSLLPHHSEACANLENRLRSGLGISSFTLPPPAPSPPLDLITMDLFEPLGPQITAVDNIDQPPPSDDSDIYIGEFEERIPLSDSD